MITKKKTGFDEVNDKLDRVIDAMVTHEDLQRLEARLEMKIDKRIGEVMTAIDHLAKSVADLLLEYAGVKHQLSRHEEWFRILAKKAKVKLDF